LLIHLLVHGITITESENTDEVLKKFFDDKLGIKISDVDINLDRIHRLRTASGPIGLIIKFACYNTKKIIFKNKKAESTRNLITESLTSTRKNCLNQLKDLKSKESSYCILDDRWENFLNS